MTNPMDALISLQVALDNAEVRLRKCDLHDQLEFLVDNAMGKTRFTYAFADGGKIKAIAILVQAEPIDKMPSFHIGYAVAEHARRTGLGSKVLELAIEEFANGMGRTQLSEIYLEAVVSVENLPSNKIARRLISSEPKQCTDCFSGEPAYQYLRKITLHPSVTREKSDT